MQLPQNVVLLFLVFVIFVEVFVGVFVLLVLFAFEVPRDVFEVFVKSLDLFLQFADSFVEAVDGFFKFVDPPVMTRWILLAMLSAMRPVVAGKLLRVAHQLFGLIVHPSGR